MLAMAADVQKITHVMDELETLEHLLEVEDAGEVSGRSIEIKNNIKARTRINPGRYRMEWQATKDSHIYSLVSPCRNL